MWKPFAVLCLIENALRVPLQKCLTPTVPSGTEKPGMDEVDKTKYTPPITRAKFSPVLTSDSRPIKVTSSAKLQELASQGCKLPLPSSDEEEEQRNKVETTPKPPPIPSSLPPTLPPPIAADLDESKTGYSTCQDEPSSFYKKPPVLYADRIVNLKKAVESQISGNDAPQFTANDKSDDKKEKEDQMETQVLKNSEKKVLTFDTKLKEPVCHVDDVKADDKVISSSESVPKKEACTEKQIKPESNKQELKCEIKKIVDDFMTEENEAVSEAPSTVEANASMKVLVEHEMSLMRTREKGIIQQLSDIKESDLREELLKEFYDNLELETTEDFLRDMVKAIMKFKSMHGYWQNLEDGHEYSASANNSPSHRKDSSEGIAPATVRKGQEINKVGEKAAIISVAASRNNALLMKDPQGEEASRVAKDEDDELWNEAVKGTEDSESDHLHTSFGSNSDLYTTVGENLTDKDNTIVSDETYEEDQIVPDKRQEENADKEKNEGGTQDVATPKVAL